jgi:replicative superfamily II helicase
VSAEIAGVRGFPATASSSPRLPGESASLARRHLSLTDSIAYEYHRPLNYDEPIVFHREQAEIYRSLLNGENIILSAPTSFGKSKVIDAVSVSADDLQTMCELVRSLHGEPTLIFCRSPKRANEVAKALLQSAGRTDNTDLQSATEWIE